MQNKSDDPFLSFRTPDPIKNLAPFSGNKKETHAWVEDTESTIALFNQYQDSPMFGQIIRAVKNKIIGEAKEILIAAGNPSDWPTIKEVLLNTYGDRRDLPSHILSLFYARQGKRTISEYYNKIRSIDTAIKTTISSMDDYKLATVEINKLISLMTLTRYMDGLGENLSMYIRSCRPDSLEEAYNITLQYSNAQYRQKMDRNPIYNPQPTRNFRDQQQFANKQQVPGSSVLQNPPNIANRTSGKFKNFKKPHDEDVSMRTHQSKMQINTHENNNKNNDKDEFNELEPPPPSLNDSTLDSDDDEYLVGDELNFLIAEDENPKT